MSRSSRKNLLCVFAVGLLIISGCSKKTDSSADPGETPQGSQTATNEQSISSSDVKQEAKEALEVTGEFSKQQMEKFRAEAQQRLESMQTRVDELKAQAAEQAEEVKPALRQQLDEIEKQIAETHASLGDMTGDTAEAWDAFQQGIGDAVKEIGQSVDEAKSKFNGQSESTN